MAALIDSVDQPTIYLSFKAEVQKAGDDGSVIVYGKCTGDDLDLDDQIIDKDFAREALQKWFNSYANIRQMHSTLLPPGGKAIKLEEKDDGFFLTSKVVEPGAVKLVNERVYSAYSIGISRPLIVADPVAKGGRVKGGIVSEVSLVDFPANPTTKFMLADEKNDVQKVFAVTADVAKSEDADLDEEVSAHLKDAKEDLDEATEAQDRDDDISRAAEADLEKKKLTTEERHDLPDSDFVFPKERKYPIPDESHARNALARVAQHGTEEEKEKVRAAVHAKFPDIKESDSDKAEEAEVTKDVSGDSATGQSYLDEAIRLMESGHSEDALKALRQAVDADLALEAKTPVAGPITAPVEIPAEMIGTDAGRNMLAGATKVEDADLAKADDEGESKEVDAEGEKDESDADDKRDDEDSEKAATARVLKVFEEYGIATQLRIRQMHDALCPAYSWKAVEGAYPTLQRGGVAGVLSKGAIALLHQLLKGNVEKSEALPEDIHHIACAYEDLMGFLAADTAEEATPSLLQSVRDDLHKAFAEFYPDAHVSPLTLDASDAGRWSRGYISNDRSPLCGSTTHASLPERKPSHVSAEDFDRGPLTAGRERPSPEGPHEHVTRGAEADLTKQRVYYTNASKEDARATMTAVHDHLARVFPELCATGAASDFQPRAMSAEMLRAQDSAPILGANPTNLTPERMPTEGHIEHTSLDDGKESDEFESEVKSAVANLTKAGKLLDVEAMKAAIMGEVKATITNMVDAEIAKVYSQTKDLSDRLEALESQPDPTQAPWRGAVVALDKLLGAKSKGEEADSVLTKAQFEARRDQAAYLTRLTESTDPSIREMARQELRKLLGS